jgi:putative NADH-flavin reductase
MTTSSHAKKILVVGATGATGKHVVQFLLNKGQNVVAVARSEEKMMSLLVTPHEGDYSKNLTIKELSISALRPSQLQELTGGCDAIVRCVDEYRVKGIMVSLSSLQIKTFCRLSIFCV